MHLRLLSSAAITLLFRVRDWLALVWGLVGTPMETFNPDVIDCCHSDSNVAVSKRVSLSCIRMFPLPCCERGRPKQDIVFSEETSLRFLWRI